MLYFLILQIKKGKTSENVGTSSSAFLLDLPGILANL